MDTSTGHLVSAEKMEEMRRALEPGGGRYIKVPQRLGRAAQRKLAGKSEAMVSLTSGGELSKWAAHERAKAAQAARRAKVKRRAKRAAEKATRRAQRGRK